jgi:hypothetical protein
MMLTANSHGTTGLSTGMWMNDDDQHHDRAVRWWGIVLLIGLAIAWWKIVVAAPIIALAGIELRHRYRDSRRESGRSPRSPVG